MKKITLLLILLTVSFGYSQNLFTDGTFDDPSAWTVIQQNGNNNATAVVAGGVVTFDDVAPAAWGAEGHVAIYKAFTVATTGWYEFDADVTTNGLDEHWFEVHVGTAAPVDGVEYNATKILTLHSWDCGATTNTYSGSMIATGCQGLDGKIQLDAGTTYYYLVRTGGITWGTGVILDDITMVAITAPETCDDGILNNGETEIDCGGTNCAPCSTPPTTAAPTPPARNAWDVISLYSDAYTDVASNFDAGWCGANSVEEVMIAGNTTLAWKSNPCQGIVLDAGVDASAFNTAAGTNLHVDLYIQAGTDVTSKVFNLKFVQQPGGGALEINLNAASTPALVAGSWVSIDVPVDLTTFTGFKEFGVTSANLNNIAWYDNLYVYRSATLGIDDVSKTVFNVYPNPSQNSWTVRTENVKMSSIKVFDILGKNVLSLSPNTSETVIDGSSLKSGLYFAQIKTATGISSMKLIKN